MKHKNLLFSLIQWLVNWVKLRHCYLLLSAIIGSHWRKIWCPCVYIYTLRICIYIIIYKSFSQQKCWLMGYHRNIMGILANCNCSSTHSWIWLRMKDTHRPPPKKTMFEGYLRLTMDKIFRLISVMSGYSCSALKIRTPEWSDGILGTSWNHVRYVKDLKWH